MAAQLRSHGPVVATTDEAIPGEGSPRERLSGFVGTFCDSYEEQSPGAAVIFGVTGIPAFDARLAEVRMWRRSEITKLVRSASREGSLRIPVKDAVALVFLATAYATWDSIVTQSGLSP
jgi:hypothetical protein